MRVGLPERLRAPRALLGLGAAAVALVCAVTAVQISVLASLDETVYKLAGVNFAEGFPSALGSDPVSRGAARLFSLILAPLFAVLEGDQAVRVGRALNGVFWAATAVPVFFIARRVVASDRGAAVAAVLSIAVPWMTVSMILFSEALTYLLFACAVLAMLRALEAPSLWRDGIALALMLVLVTARMQFAVLPVAWLAVVVLFEWRRGPRAAARRYPATSALTALAIVGALGLVALGGLSGELDRFGGPYSGLKEQGLPRDAGLALLSQVALLALGVGLVAAVLAGAWYRDALRSRLGEPALRFAVLTLALVAVLFASTVWAQGGWLDDKTEERYYIYAVPFLWIAAVAAVRDVAALSAWRVLGGGLVLAAVLFLVPVTVAMNGEQMFLGPVSGVIADATPRVDDLVTVTRRDLAGWTAVLVAIAAALLWRRRRAAALALSVALQLGLVLYALAAVHGRMEPIPGVLAGEPFAALGWIDRGLSAGTDAGVAENGGSSRDTDVLHALFWNDAVRFRLGLGDATYQPPYPADALGRIDTQPGRDLTLDQPVRGPVAGVRDSARWQLDGRALAADPRGRFELVQPASPARLRWHTEGLEPAGDLVRNVQLNAAAGRRWTLRFKQPPDGQVGRIRVRLGRETQRVTLPPGQSRSVTFDLCSATANRTGVIGLEQALTSLGAGRYSAGVFAAARGEACS